MRLALTAGGTGGHILPALAVLNALQRRDAITAVRFFGPDNRGEREMVESHGLDFETVPAAGVRGRNPIALGRSFGQLGAGVFAAVRKLRAFRPDAVFSTGGYGSFPGSLAARVLRRPLVVYLPDVRPGWAVRVEKRLATHLATTTEAALEFLPRRKTRVTGYPVRPAFFETNRASARTALGVAEGDRLVVVAGATQGAQAINRAVFGALGDVVPKAKVFHITGEADIAEADGLRAALPDELRQRYQPSAYRDDLPLVMVAADLAVMRAGASVLGELPAASLPAILVPGTFAGGHQRDNARWLEQTGAAVILEEARLELLCGRILEILADGLRLDSMRASAAALARPDAAERIADLVLEAAQR